jgi:hypothetical protein
VASQPPRVTWTEESFSAFQQLPFDIRRQIIDKLDIVQRYPRVYQLQTGRHWARARSIRLSFALNNARKSLRDTSAAGYSFAESIENHRYECPLSH